MPLFAMSLGFWAVSSDRANGRRGFGGVGCFGVRLQGLGQKQGELRCKPRGIYG